MTSRFTFRMWPLPLYSQTNGIFRVFSETEQQIDILAEMVWNKSQWAPTGAWFQSANALTHRDFHPDSAGHTLLGEQLSLLWTLPICNIHVWQLGSQHFFKGTKAEQHSSVLQPHKRCNGSVKFCITASSFPGCTYCPKPNEFQDNWNTIYPCSTI